MNSSLLFPTLVTLIGFTSVVTATTIQDVCVKSMFPQACAQFLNSDPRRTTTDLLVIADIALDKAREIVTTTDEKIKSLLAKPKDPLQQRPLKDCLSLYDFAIFNIGRADDLIRKRDFEGLNGVGGVINTSGVECAGNLGGPLLRDENTNARVIGEVIAVISNFLIGKM